MILVYLYVMNPIEALRGKELNFSSRYEINLWDDFERNDERTEYRFRLKRKEFFDDILYGPNIEVYGIVGNNGTGKSTVLDYIRRLHYDCESFMEEEGFAISVWEEQGQFYLCQESMQRESIPIRLYDDVTGAQISFIHANKIKSTTSMLYYSDIVDEKYVYNQFDGSCINSDLFGPFRNVSTSFYLQEASNALRRLRSHFQSEVGRELDFIGEVTQNYESLKELYHIPNQLDMMVTLTDFKKIEKNLRFSLSDYTRDIHQVSNGALMETSFITIAKLLKYEYEALKKMLIKAGRNQSIFFENEVQIIQAMVMYNGILDLIQYMMDQEYQYDEESLEDERPVYFTELDSIFDRIMGELYAVMPSYPRNNPFIDNMNMISSFNGLIWDVLCNSEEVVDAEEYLNCLKRYVLFIFRCTSVAEVGANPSKAIVRFRIDTKSSDYMDKLLPMYKEYKVWAYHNWMQFSWGMSSGEKSRVTLFARFYDALKWRTAGDYIILLDELDYYMHPSWQQNILSEFILFLKTMFPNCKFQVIFTTHSPITLSDVRKENILFLSSEISKEQMEETFAANIAALYLSAFSMDKGSIGLIGKCFLNKVIRALGKVNKNDNQLEGKESMRERQILFLTKYYGKSKEEMMDCDFEAEIKRIKRLVEYIGEDIFRIKTLEKFEECKLLPDEKENKLQQELEQLIRNYGRAELLEYFNKK